MKHLDILKHYTLEKIEIGEYFTYRIDGFFRKGLKVSNKYMIPISLYCHTKKAAQDSY